MLFYFILKLTTPYYIIVKIDMFWVRMALKDPLSETLIVIFDLGTLNDPRSKITMGVSLNGSLKKKFFQRPVHAYFV